MKFVKGQHHLKVEYFEAGGKAGISLNWAPGRRFVPLHYRYLRYKPESGFKEEVHLIVGPHLGIGVSHCIFSHELACQEAEPGTL